MKFYLRNLILSLIIQLLIINSNRLFCDEAGYTSESMLLPTGARILSLGGAFVGLADDVTAISKNSSGLMQINRKQVNFMVSNVYDGLVKYGSINFVFGHDKDKRLGISYAYLSVDNIPNTSNVTYLDDQGNSTSSVDKFNWQTNDVVIYDPQFESSISLNTLSLSELNLCYSRYLTPQLFIGANLKFMSQQVMTFSGDGISIDLSLLYKLFPYLRFGLVVRDLSATGIKWSTGWVDKSVPSISTGISLQINKIPVPYLNGLIVVTDLTTLKYGYSVNSGMELRVYKFLSLRAGTVYSINKFVNYTAGLGIKLSSSWILNYTFATASGSTDTLGNVHMLDLTFHWLR